MTIWHRWRLEIVGVTLWVVAAVLGTVLTSPPGLDLTKTLLVMQVEQRIRFEHYFADYLAAELLVAPYLSAYGIFNAQGRIYRLINDVNEPPLMLEPCPKCSITIDVKPQWKPETQVRMI